MGAAKSAGTKVRWPDLPCPDPGPLTAADQLHAITWRAIHANASNLSAILRLALRCAAHGYLTNLPHDEHCKLVLRAAFQAEQNRWDQVETLLDHT